MSVTDHPIIADQLFRNDILIGFDCSKWKETLSLPDTPDANSSVEVKGKFDKQEKAISWF